jgi:PAS domain S-box-containing protein
MTKEATEGENAGGTRRHTVLLVCADADLATTVMDRLTRWLPALQIPRIKSPAEVDRSIEEQVPDAILICISPAAEGIALCRRLYQNTRWSSIPRLLYMGDSSDDTGLCEQAFSLAHGILQSPLTSGALCSLTRSLISGSRQGKLEPRTLSSGEKRYQSVFENTGAATIIIDEDMIISEANRQFEKLSGYPRVEIEKRMKWPRFIHPDDVERMKYWHSLRRRNQGQAPTIYEFRFLKRDGSVRHILLRIGMIADTSQSVASLVDISPRKRAEEALRASEKKYRTILDSIEEGYYEVDLKGTLKFVNEPMCRLVGFPREQLLTMNNQDYTSPETAKKMYQLYNRIYRTREPSGILAFSLQRKDRKLSVELSANLITDEVGEPVGFRGLLRDVTNRNRAEKRRREFERLQGVLEMAGAICHEMNQPLQSMLGYADLLALSQNTTQTEKACITGITDQVDRIKSITGKLMHITRYQTVEYLNGSKIFDIHGSTSTDDGSDRQAGALGHAHPPAEE